LTGRTAIELEPTVLAALASLDGATVTDDEGNLIAAGAILRHADDGPVAGDDSIIEGARTTAAMAASRYGPVLKVSEDGGITLFDREKIWDI
jgi:DNA integrity scanning protein DisA with diadenylate cyclase activity